MTREDMYMLGCLFAVNRLIENGSFSYGIKVNGKWETVPRAEIKEWIEKQYAIEQETEEWPEKKHIDLQCGLVKKRGMKRLASRYAMHWSKNLFLTK